MTERGLNAVLDSQVKLGANASVAVATIGAGIQGSTTTAVGADIVAFAESRGLFGGVALEGSVMSTQTDWDQTYYNQPTGSRQIVMQMQGNNPGADPLRDILTRYGARATAPAYAPPQPAPGYAPAYPPYQQPSSPPPSYAPPPSGGPTYLTPPPGGHGPVQEQGLAPPPQ